MDQNKYPLEMSGEFFWLSDRLDSEDELCVVPHDLFTWIPPGLRKGNERTLVKAFSTPEDAIKALNDAVQARHNSLLNS
jgi:hypothetical protein